MGEEGIHRYPESDTIRRLHLHWGSERCQRFLDELECSHKWTHEGQKFSIIVEDTKTSKNHPKDENPVDYMLEITS